MLTRESIAFIDSNRETHFTDALVQYASEYENIQISPDIGTGDARCFIASITLRTATNLAWLVSFHRTDVHSLLAATPYQPAQWVDHWAFAAADAVPTATEYVYAVTGLKIPYKDEDNTGELHLGLHNQSSTGKGALGAAVPSGVTTPQYVQVTIGVIGAA